MRVDSFFDLPYVVICTFSPVDCIHIHSFNCLLPYSIPGDLRCYEEDGSSVPGCLGVRVSGFDYCYDPNDGKSSSDLSYVALNPAYALQHCESHCKSDTDCSGYLVCYDNPTSEEVPGCSGDRLFLKEDEAFSYCVRPTDWAEYDPDTTPAAAESKPSEVGGSTEEDKGKDTNFTNPQDPPPSSNLQPKPVEIDDSESKPSKVSISLPDMQIALTFNSPKRIRRLATARNLIINNDIDEATIPRQIKCSQMMWGEGSGKRLTWSFQRPIMVGKFSKVQAPPRW